MNSGDDARNEEVQVSVDSQPTRVRRPLLSFLLAGVVAIAVIGGVLLSPAGDQRPGRLDMPIDPRYPDLSMAPVGVAGIGVTEDGRWLLRFSATIVNVGEGEFSVTATRPITSRNWNVRQQIADRDDQYTEISTPADLVWGGDDHDHWHVREVETHWLETLDSGVRLGTVIKPGFCFFDNTEHNLELPEAPQGAVYSYGECGERSDTSVSMGLSVGWGDIYEWHLFEQHIDITNITPGRYRIRAVADPEDWFQELDEENNGTWTIVAIDRGENGEPLLEVIEEAPPP